MYDDIFQLRKNSLDTGIISGTIKVNQSLYAPLIMMIIFFSLVVFYKWWYCLFVKYEIINQSTNYFFPLTRFILSSRHIPKTSCCESIYLPLNDTTESLIWFCQSRIVPRKNRISLLKHLNHTSVLDWMKNDKTLIFRENFLDMSNIKE